MSLLKDNLALAWASDLKLRVPAGHPVFAMRRDADVEPPFSVVTVMRMQQATPGSNAWIADVKVVCVCDKDQGGSAEQKKRLGEIYTALEATPDGADVDLGVRLCGFSLRRSRSTSYSRTSRCRAAWTASRWPAPPPSAGAAALAAADAARAGGSFANTAPPAWRWPALPSWGSSMYSSHPSTAESLSPEPILTSPVGSRLLLPPGGARRCARRE